MVSQGVGGVVASQGAGDVMVSQQGVGDVPCSVCCVIVFGGKWRVNNAFQVTGVLLQKGPSLFASTLCPITWVQSERS